MRTSLQLGKTCIVSVALMLLALFCGQASGQTLTTLDSFNETNGRYPLGTLIQSGSTLYGMTFFGGT